MSEPWGEILGIIAFFIAVVILHFFLKLCKKWLSWAIRGELERMKEEEDRSYGAPW